MATWLFSTTLVSWNICTNYIQ